MMRKAGVLTGVALLVGLGAAYGCGSSFRTCDQTRTCAPQSEGGPDASTEAAPPDAARDGDASSSSCTTNADCDDGKACDGVERCVNGACVAGKPVTCANPDPAHCNAVCVEAGGGATNCEVQPRDADGDGHGDALCTEAKVPGDDCNDTNKNVYPGAPEICDGLDDNCNGKVDDGLPLGGTVKKFVQSVSSVASVDAAWSSSQNLFGVVWIDTRNGPAGDVYFARMDAQGNKIGSDVQISADPGGSLYPHIAAQGDRFGVAWAGGVPAKPYFRAVDATTSTPVGAGVAVSTSRADGSVGIAGDGSGGWIEIYASADLRGILLAANGSAAGTEKVLASGGTLNVALLPSIRRAGSVFGVSEWFTSGLSAGEVSLSLHDSSLTYLGGTAWESPGQQVDGGSAPGGEFPALATDGSRFMTLWSYATTSNAGTVRAGVETPGLSTVCENHNVATGDVLSAAFDGRNYVASYTTSVQPPYTPALLALTPTCTSVFSGVSLPEAPNGGAWVAAGGNRLAIFSVSNEPAAPLNVRVVSNLYCK